MTADVIDSMEGTKVDRFQMSRADIVAYITLMAENQPGFSPGPDAIELMAALIVSFEASTSAWTLQAPSTTGTGSVHLKMQQLYNDVLLDSDHSKFPIYSAHTDKIERLGNSALYVKQSKKLAQSGGGARLDSDQLSNDAVCHRIAACRIIDHVYQLMMDPNIWYQFVVPRQKADLASNLERSRGLKTFSLYCQSLLTYASFFMLETFMASYDLVQKWITHFPPIEGATLQRLESIIRGHDILDARADVRHLFESLNADKDAGSPVKDALVFPSEMLAPFGIAATVTAASQRADAASFSALLTDLAALDSPAYMPLTAGSHLGQFDVVYNVTDVVLIGKVVSAEIDKALASMVPALVRGVTTSIVADLKALDIRCALPLAMPTALTYEVVRGVDKGIRANSLNLDSAAPQFSRDYQMFIKKNFRFKAFVNTQVPRGYDNFVIPMVFDYDKAHQLRQLIGLEWQSLVPAVFGTGSTVIKPAEVAGSQELLRSVIEDIAGVGYETAVREMELPQLRKLWATFLSSFALLYVDEKLIGKRNYDLEFAKPTLSSSADGYQLSEGYGMPYGHSYASLASLQGVVSEDTPIINVFPGLGIRFLVKIPLPSSDLKLQSDFFNEHPHSYFLANGTTLDVTEWVKDDGLLHHACFPVRQSSSVPAIRFTNKYYYLNADLLLNMDLNFKPETATKARETFPIPVSRKDWTSTKTAYFLDFMTFPAYASGGHGSVDQDAIDEQIVNATKAIEQRLNADAAQGAAGIGTDAAVGTDILGKERSLQGGPESKSKHSGDEPNADIIV